MIIGSKKIFVEKLSSTNSHASWLLKKGKVQEGTIVHTAYQTAGRGQGSNRWESEPGKNLLFSIILYPISLKAEKQFAISRVISLGIKEFLTTFVQDVSIKWPNDIYVRNDKIAGMLIENAIIRGGIEYTIAGVGININQKKFSGGAPNPTSLSIISGKDFDIAECLEKVSNAIDIRYKQLKNPKLNSDYLASLYRYDQWTEFRDGRGVFEGRITNVADSGRIQIEDRKSRTYEYGHGEVDFF